MKILVTGTSGQLGYDVLLDLKKNGFDVLSPSHLELDITDSECVIDYFNTHEPDGVIHCAAWTNVDGAEDETDSCRAVNVGGTSNIVRACKLLSIPILYISTDYIFPGDGSEPWGVDSPADPINEYGRSKYDGEVEVRRYDKHYIVRISWVFGINGNNFVRTMLRLSESHDVLKVVNDQIGSPTYTADLAPLLRELLMSGKYGTYHAHNEGYCSWFDFALEIMRLSGRNISVLPIPSSEFPTKAKRPFNSRMDMTKLYDVVQSRMPDWKDALSRYLHQLNEKY